MLNRTKIIATVGPSIDSDQKVENLVRRGMSVLRINCSHGTLSSRQRHLQRVRRVEKKLGSPIGVMLDLQGPKLRVGDLPSPIHLHSDDVWRLLYGRPASRRPVGERTIPLSFRGLSSAVQVGDFIYMDDGLIRSQVIRKLKDSVFVRIIHGGLLESRKGLNIPSHKGRLPILSEKDKTDLEWGLRHGVDFVALSFVRKAEDIRRLKDFIHKKNPRIKPLVVAKIEKPEAVTDMENVIQACDVILVARGDLGIELPPEKVPVIQKQLIERCRYYRKPIIVATQMLDSMRWNPIPTRAEVSDVASAIFAGVDAVLLTGETSSGKFPVEACSMMQKIILEVEHHMAQKLFRKKPQHFGLKTADENAMFNAMQMADDIGASAIVVLARKGNLTKVLSKLHPKQPIFALASSLHSHRQLNLFWGVFPIEIQARLAGLRMEQGLKVLKARKAIRSKDRLLFIFRDFRSENLNLKMVEVS